MSKKRKVNNRQNAYREGVSIMSRRNRKAKKRTIAVSGFNRHH